MTRELFVLCVSAASIGLLHTLFGPDHYLPFIVLSKARKWSMKRTLVITAACGTGHVLSSVALGLAGVGLGVSLMKLEALEAVRGNLAAWFLIGFGFGYFLWGIRRALKSVPHTHAHHHGSGFEHNHRHDHTVSHSHLHEKQKQKLTPWILFTIFVFGPCEALIPLLMYPAVEIGWLSMILVTAVFAVVTVATMMLAVTVGAWGLKFARFRLLERFAHAFSGAAICLSGLAIQLLGL